MIAKIDHVAISSTNLDRDIQSCMSKGYSLTFAEKHIDNLHIKRTLMKTFSIKQSLALLDGHGNYPVELIDHGHVVRGNSRVELNLDELTWKTHTLEESSRFWGMLGFEVQTRDHTSVLMTFKSILHPRPLHLRLLQSRVALPKLYLDSEGPNCLAFITTSPDDQRQILEKHGYQTTDGEQLNLNDKLIEVWFARGPSGELAEFISVLHTTPHGL